MEKKCAKKQDGFSWASPGERGKFEWVPKTELKVDHSYHRGEVSKKNTLDIAENWDWKLCGCITVMRRKDGSLWVMDGGQRLFAALCKDDISDLPCLVFS